MYCVDHPSDVKRGGVCIYYKTVLSLQVSSKIFLQECIYSEVSIRNKKFFHFYRTPSQSQDQFHDFLTNFEINLHDSFSSSLFLTTAIGQFNPKSNKWSEGDRSTIDQPYFSVWLSQIIKHPSHILENSFSCIDIIFTTKSNGIRIWSSLFTTPKRQLQTIFANFNLKVYYSPPYERTVFHYSQANVDHIQQAINLSDWENAFLNTDVDSQVSIFSNTVLNILNNYISHETKICDDCDPSWITTKMK